MSRSLNLNSYLEDQQDDGEFQGTGQFTIEHQKAAQKMARFALPRSTAWVCKFVQAAVGWSIKALTINQGKTYMVFHFEWPKLSDLPTEDDVVKGILSSGISDEQPMANLCLGLRALVELGGLSFLVVLNDGELKPRPIYSGTHFSEMSEEDRLVPGFGRRLGLTVTVAHTPAQQSGDQHHGRAYYQAKIVRELDTYCFLSPVPIKLDGRRIDGPIRTPGFQARAGFRPIYTGGPPVEDGSPALKVPESFEERRMSVYTDPRRARRPYQGKCDVTAVVLLGVKVGGKKSTATRNTTIYWVRRGVIVDSSQFFVETEALVCEVYLSADDLPTDLTGFRVSNAEAEKRKPFYLRRLKEYLSRLPLEEFAFSQDRDEQSPQDERLEQSEMRSERIKKILKGSGPGLGLALFSPLLGSVIALGNIVKVYAFERADRDSEIVQLQELLRSRLIRDKEKLMFGLSAQRTLDGRWKSDSGSTVTISTSVSGLSITVEAARGGNPGRWEGRWIRQWDLFEYSVAGVSFTAEASDDWTVIVESSNGKRNTWRRQ